MARSRDIGGAPVPGRYCELSTGRLPHGEQWWQWREAGLHSYATEFPAEVAQRPFTAMVRSFLTPSIELRDITTDPLLVRRTPAHCRNDGEAKVMLSAIIEAARPPRFDHVGTTNRVVAGHILISDLSRPFSLDAGSYRVVNLRLDRSAVSSAIGADPGCLHGQVLAESPLALLLFGQIHCYAHLLPAMTDEVRQVGLDAIADMALATLRLEARSGPPDAGAHWSGLWQAACRFIERNLDRTDMSPELLASVLRCSRTQVYRLFARQDQTVMGYVLARRLLRSREMLADPECRHSIAAVAWMCGFEDPSAFSRSFRRRFGCQPRDVRRQAQTIDRYCSAAEHDSPATMGNQCHAA